MIESIGGSLSTQMYNSARMNRPKPEGDPDEMMLKKIDSDSSGTADKTEFSTFLSEIQKMSGKELNSDEIFAQLDEDEDGVISKSEMVKMKEILPPPPPPEMSGDSSQIKNSYNSEGATQNYRNNLSVIDFLA
ncbi:MAG: EF-hand domain-containing protein [Candidatus Delongbacteria bacterium]|nr:EF-hand domain-containing protein [Candidatus Delongbacteria bacterium]MBN2835477.1 EF-hand domain-containing protein [Candidatus Delongbacteria bacterium]